MKLTNNEEKTQYKSILVTLAIKEIRNREYIEDIDSSVKEFIELAEAADIEVLGNIVQNKETVDVTYFIGKGKVDEIKEFALSMEANLIIFNHELSGSQIRNLESEIGIDVIDRTMLILEIFAKRAITKDGKLQVELAQLKYRLPRLVGLGEKLSRLGAGIGTRGPGEKKLETDKRHIQSRIYEIERDLKDIAKNRDVQRAKRSKSALPIVALVGYTNAGKSTILNEIIKRNKEHSLDKEVFVKDMLFATLDTHVRKSNLSNGNEYLLTDTVGFVSRLPHTLVKAFKSTLEEIQYADLLLHIADASDKNYELQKHTTQTVLKELNYFDKPILIVNNKMDKATSFINMDPKDEHINISAFNPNDIEELVIKIENYLLKSSREITLFFPYDKSNLVNEVHQKYSNVFSEYENDGIKLTFVISAEDENKYRMYILE